MERLPSQDTIYPRLDVARNASELGDDAIITDWVQGEDWLFNGAPQVMPLDSAIILKINPKLPFRRLYFYAEVKLTPTTADYWVKASLRFRKGGQPVATFPASIGKDANVRGTTQSLVSTNVASDFPAAQSVTVFFKTYWAGAIFKAQLNPTNVNAVADSLTYDIEDARAIGSINLDALRVFIGIRSSNSPLG